MSLMENCCHHQKSTCCDSIQPCIWDHYTDSTRSCLLCSSSLIEITTPDIKEIEYEEEKEWDFSWIEHALVMFLACILLVASLLLTIYWVLQHRGGFAWSENPKKEFNYHSVFMVAGFVTITGFSMLLYKMCRCYQWTYITLLHSVCHTLAIPCIIVGFLTVLDSRNLANPPQPNFFSIHSWVGLVAMGVFVLQFMLGFFSALIPLNAEFRQTLSPVHSSLGMTTFMLGIMACLTGLTELVILTIKDDYLRWQKKYSEESIIVNSLGIVLVALAILIPFAIRKQIVRDDTKVYVTRKF